MNPSYTGVGIYKDMPGLLFDPDPTDKPEGKVEDKPAEKETPETPQPADETTTIVEGGQVYKLDKEQMQAAAQKGIQAYVKEQQAPEVEVKEPETDLSNEEKLEKRLDKLEKEKELSTLQAQRQQQQETARNKTEAEFEQLAKEHNITDPEMARAIKDQALGAVLYDKNETRDVKEIYKEKVEFFKKVSGKNYVERKIADRNKTIDSGEGGESPGSKPDPLTKKDWDKGKVRERAAARLRGDFAGQGSFKG